MASRKVPLLQGIPKLYLGLRAGLFTPGCHMTGFQPAKGPNSTGRQDATLYRYHRSFIVAENRLEPVEVVALGEFLETLPRLAMPQVAFQHLLQRPLELLD